MSHAPDELLSALLDGEPVDGDVAHVDSCDECRARLDQLRGASRAVATAVVSPPTHVRDAAIREATLAAADQPGSARILTLRRRPDQLRRRPNPFSAVAALLVAVLVGGFALSTINRGGNSSGEATLAVEPADVAANAGALDLAPQPADAISVLIRRAALEIATPNGRAASGGSVGAPADSKTAAPSCTPLDDASLLWHAAVGYDGQSVIAEVVKVDDAHWVMRLRSQPPACSLIASRDFSPTPPR